MTDKQRLALLRKARRELEQTGAGYRVEPKGGHWTRAFAALDELAVDFLPEKPQPKASWEAIGPVTPSGISLLDMSLTHNTDGIDLFPAVDTAWGIGKPMIAPEDLTIDTKDTHAAPGEADYATGKSGMRYWFAHLDRDFPLGRKVKKGQLIGLTIDQARPHGHVGVNAEKFLGKGKQLRYGKNGNGPDYTLGAPTIREQLRKAAASNHGT